MLEILEKPVSSKLDRHLLFFQVILSSLQNVNDDETTKLQLGVLNLIKNVKNHHHSFSPTYNFPSHELVYNASGFSVCSSMPPPSPAADSCLQATSGG
jgi:hypothetical protein